MTQGMLIAQQMIAVPRDIDRLFIKGIPGLSGT
jgi:hypothetical protein